ncbi:MAG TPA: hypothetical protein VK888_00005, partial [Anaerolineales bacterium]|nr:hypothetical protein [Anaerolineales bacterium]
RSDLDELDEYLKRAMATHETIAAFQEADVSVYSVKNMAGNVQEWTATECSFADVGFWKKAGQKFSDSVLTIKKAGQAISPVNLRGGFWKNVRSLAPSVHHLWKDSGLG